MGMPSNSARLYTVEDVRAITDDLNRYEIIDGELFVTPAPGFRHQAALARLFRVMANYVAEHHLGILFSGPFDVVFSRLTLVEPDLLFVHRDRRHVFTEREFPAAPDLAVEIISPSTVRTDRTRKRSLYQTQGVREYWVVDPKLRQIEVWRADALEPSVHRENLTWQPDAAVAPLPIAVPDLFQDP